MNLKNDYQYPHPVLMNTNKYFTKSKLDFKLNYLIDGNVINITYKLTIKSEFIKNLIDKQYASIYLMLESTNSMYRESIIVEEINTQNTTRVDLKKIKDSITITPIIVANFHIENYTSEEFVDSNSYLIEKNDILGFFPTKRYQISNSNEQFDTLSSIFTIRESKRDINNIKYDLEGDYVTIILDSKRSYDILFDLNTKGSLNHILYSMYILTPLTTCLRELYNPKYENYRWRSVIIDTLLGKGKKDLDFTYDQAFVIAQELLDYPMSNALEELEKFIGGNQ